MKTIAWFSAGVSSAVSIKFMASEIDRVIYIHIDDQHPDTMRFIEECGRWFGKKIEVMQSPYKTVINAVKSIGYINGVHGAGCTRLLKKRVRQEWEMDQAEPLRYVWGMDYNERHRAERIYETMPNQEHVFPLIDRKLSKELAHEILIASGIKRPAIYDLGYHNNNCVGCVKGGMGYWNKIRVDFPEVFAARAKLEREIGGSCINGVFLDALAPERGRHAGPIVADCGILCETIAI
ncbi:MAG: phosphoadenosine phosphosulfate reductase [Pseudomonadota bacterium]|uniref:Putative phosphoadenosine phosphosulfate n=1 Tax=viral metagenome TaxID=1070528 RepID=A0A6M3K209_9ZZZZ